MNYVYLLRCADDTLYCGWTPDLTARLAAHNGGRGAKYTRGRGPVWLAYSEILPTKSDALRREAAIKRLSRAEKELLIASQSGDELLTIYDADGNACGERPRSVVHAQGLRHRVCHLWVCGTFRNDFGVWLQQRAPDRPLYPGFYDLTATGHADPGETPEAAMVREAREEVGLHLHKNKLLHAGCFPQQYARAEGGFDDELADAFLFLQDGIPPFSPGDEVTQLVFVPLTAFAAAHDAGSQPVPAVLPDGTALPLPRDHLCCLHDSEWAGVQQALKEHAKVQT